MSFGINCVTISGNLTAEPDLRETPGGMEVLRLGIAYNGRKKNQGGEWEDQAHFFDVTYFGGTAKWLASNLSKGQGVVVKGRLEQRRWQDKETGANRYAVSIIGDDIVVPRGDGGSGGGSSSGGSSQTRSSQTAPPAASPVPGGTMGDDIPFFWEGPLDYEDRRGHSSRRCS